MISENPEPQQNFRGWREFRHALIQMETIKEQMASGITPVTYGKGGKRAEIRFATTPCELGWLLVARTARGICAVRLGDEEAKLEADLRTEFHAANIHRASDEGALSEEIDYLLQLLRGQGDAVIEAVVAALRPRLRFSRRVA